MQHVVSWAEYHSACAELADRLRHDARLDRHTTVLAIARGGLVPATILAYALRLDKLMAAPLASIGLWSAYSNVLVVDDICDTGRTFREVRKHLPEAVYAAPYVKPRGKPLCTHWSCEVAQDTWVVMPYAPEDEINR